jgi:O-antigen ligase
MRLLALWLINIFGIVKSFQDAFYGLLLYSFWSFAHPMELIKWVNLEQYKLSFAIALITILTAIAQKKKIICGHVLTYLSILFLLQCWLSEVVAGYYPSASELLLKMIIITFVTATLIEDVSKFRRYVLFVALCLGGLGAYYGFAGFLKGNIAIFTGGAEGIIGNVKGYDNNHYAMWLNMGLPFVWYVGANLKKAYLRNISKVAFIGNVIAVMLTMSRAGSMSCAVVLALIFLRKRVVIFLLPAVGFVLLFLSPQAERISEPMFTPFQQEESVPGQSIEAYKAKMGTMSEGPEKVRTAQSRMSYWKTAIAMAEDNPLFGVGFQHYYAEFEKYDVSKGEFGLGLRAIHNTTLCILAGTGYPGFLLHIFIMLAYFATLVRSRKNIIEYMDGEETTEFLSYTRMMAISMAAFLVNGSFIDEPTSEITWMLIGVAIALERITKGAKGQR